MIFFLLHQSGYWIRKFLQNYRSLFIKKNIDDFDFRFFGLDSGSKNCFLNFQHGIASSIGEQPVKGLLNPAAGARMSVAEALSNLVFAKISSLNVRIFYF